MKKEYEKEYVELGIYLSKNVWSLLALDLYSVYMGEDNDAGIISNHRQTYICFVFLQLLVTSLPFLYFSLPALSCGLF